MEADNYALRVLTRGTVSALGAAVLVAAAVIVGQLLVVGLLRLFGAEQVNDLRSFITLLCVSFGFGLMSGVGVILVIVDLWCLIKLLHEEIAPVDFFFLVAASQVGFYIGATVIAGTFHETWPVGILGLGILGLAWWGTRILRRRAEAALLVRMKEEGEQFRGELRKRHSERLSRFRR